MRPCNSPPQLKTSHIVQVAASIAQEASTALPPFEKIMAPAVAASGFPVMAIQCLPWSGGFWVCTGKLLNDCPFIIPLRQTIIESTNNRFIFLNFFTGKGI
jgi:hypothetical protein